MDTKDAIRLLTAAGQLSEVRRVLEGAAVDAKRAYQPIQADRSLNDRTKHQRLAKAYTKARDKAAAELADAATKAIRDDKHDAETVWGTRGMQGDPASLAISRRDAGDRVAAINDVTVLERLLARADRSGDELLCRAIAERAVELGSVPVINQYLDPRPELNEAATRLWTAGQVNVRDVIVGTGLLAQLPPAELRDLDPYKVAELAADPE